MKTRRKPLTKSQLTVRYVSFELFVMLLWATTWFGQFNYLAVLATTVVTVTSILGGWFIYDEKVRKLTK